MYRVLCGWVVVVSFVLAARPVGAQDGGPVKARADLKGHGHVVAAVRFTPDGRGLVSGSWDETVRWWNTETGAPQHTWTEPTDWIETVAISPDGKTLLAASQRAVDVWDLEGRRHKATYDAHRATSNSVVQLSEDGRWLACGVRNGTVTVWEVGAPKPKWTLTTGVAWTKCLAFSHDGTRLAAGSWLGRVRIWELPSGRELQSFEGHANSVIAAVCFSPDGEELATGSYDASVKRWDVRTGELKSTWTGHEGLVLSLAYSPEGQRLASGERHGPIKLWNVKTGELITTYVGHPDDKLGFSVVALAFAPDGKTIASGGYDAMVKLWSVPGP